MVTNNNATTFDDAFARLAEGLTTQQSIKVGSFWEFIRDIWSLSYDNPEYFNAWHVGLLAEDIEYCLEEGLNYCAILPRFHFKSTVLGHAFSVWRLLKAPRDCSVLYLSYSDLMSRYHIAEINKVVQRNPVLTQWMTSRSPKADFSFRYYVNKKPMEISHGGLFSFKRGMHVNGALIADDVLRDPENPLNLSQLTKVEDHFLTETMFIPLKGIPVIVLGTPMMPGDLLTVLQKDDRFKTRVLPALDPVPGRRVLMPELYNEEWLLRQQRARPKAFASEFLLQPYFSTEAYFEEDDIRKCEDPKLINHPVSKSYSPLEDGDLFAGFDVGKKRHPSHLVIFKKTGDRIEQVHQSWLDGWSYSDQIAYLNDVTEQFNLMRGYIDNTRGELEDRGLNNIWRAMHFTTKSKNTMAQVFEQYVHSGQLKLLSDERQRGQILCVSNELKAPVTPMGHGDAFFSIAMALYAAYECSLNSFQNLGNVVDWMNDISSDLAPSESGSNPIQEITNQWVNSLTNKTPDTYNTSQVSNTGGGLAPVNPMMTPQKPNPDCEEPLCAASFWVTERKLCLFCGHRG